MRKVIGTCALDPAATLVRRAALLLMFREPGDDVVHIWVNLDGQKKRLSLRRHDSGYSETVTKPVAWSQEPHSDPTSSS